MTARVQGNVFDERGAQGGIGGGRQPLVPNKACHLLRNWRASPDPFSTVLVFGVAYQNPQLITDDPSDAFVRIRYGTANRIGEDDCQVVDVDLFNGMAITVLGNCLLSVEAIYGPLISTDQNATQPPLMIDLSIAHGFNPCNARRTVKVGTILANAASARFPIPIQAREAFLVNSNLAVPAVTMAQFLTLNGPVNSTDVLGKKIDTTVQYAHGATFFTLATGAAASNDTAVIWRLNL